MLHTSRDAQSQKFRYTVAKRADFYVSSRAPRCALQDAVGVQARSWHAPKRSYVEQVSRRAKARRPCAKYAACGFALLPTVVRKDRARSSAGPAVTVPHHAAVFVPEALDQRVVLPRRAIAWDELAALAPSAKGKTGQSDHQER